MIDALKEELKIVHIEVEEKINKKGRNPLKIAKKAKKNNQTGE